MPGSLAVIVALLFAFIPAQARHTSRMALEVRQDACAGLSSAECCAQTLELAGFRATGDQVPKPAKLPVRLSCTDAEQVVPEGACRSIAIGRGISAKDVSSLCTPATLSKRCDASAQCKSCVADLEKLKFSEPARACYAVTYTPPALNQTETVIIVNDESKGASGSGGIEIRKRRTVLR